MPNLGPYSKEEWEIFLPDNDRYFLRLATRKISKDLGLFPSEFQEHEVSAGRYKIELRQREFETSDTFEVILDGQPVITISEQDWKSSGVGSYAKSSCNVMTSQQSTNQPFELIRRRFNIRKQDGTSTDARTIDEPTNGALVWVEKLPAD